MQKARGRVKAWMEAAKGLRARGKDDEILKMEMGTMSLAWLLGLTEGCAEAGQSVEVTSAKTLVE